ncbi:MAG: 30S ribosomal protein S12 methylthiotransferase RimO [Acidimicrobiales bacterium]
MAEQYWVETLGCPKNQVDSDKLVGSLVRDGLSEARSAGEADLVVVNTCAFIEEARQESIDTILQLGDDRKEGAKLVVTGCMAERYGDELAEALPEVDAVTGFNRSVNLAHPKRIDSPGLDVVSAPLPDFDLLNLPRPPATAPWAYVKIAEGCDRQCGFCAIPSFRGKQRSRSMESILKEVDELGAREIVLVAQDLARYGKDLDVPVPFEPLVQQVAERVDRVRLLYLYPSELTESLIETILATEVPYFDLSLQHVSRPLVKRMRRWGDGKKYAASIARIRQLEPEATMRSNFIVGYPGETEDDHELLLRFVEEMQLDWCGFFAFSDEEATYAHGLDGHVPSELIKQRLTELTALQDSITAHRRDRFVDTKLEVLVDEPGIGRSVHEAPEIDGIVYLDSDLVVGELCEVTIVESMGPDLVASGAVVS